ncbi:MAG: hypothetical protein AB6733_24320 [Clostridiaceae bacterium]
MAARFDDLEELILRSKEEVNISSNYNDTLLKKLNSQVILDNNVKPSIFSLFDKTAGLSFTMTGLLFMFINIFGLNYQILEFFFKLKEIYLLVNFK